jgi:hypothetical protein
MLTVELFGSLFVGFSWLVWKDETRKTKELKNKKKNNRVTGEGVLVQIFRNTL